MKNRNTFVAAAVLLFLGAGSALAQLSPAHQEWAEGPVQHLMTRDEQRAWDRVKTDEAAQQFIDLFWARRDPTPATPHNEWKEAFEQRAAYADEHFEQGRTRGAMTERGRVLILLGAPTRLARSGERSLLDRQQNDTSLDQPVPTEIWTWDQEQVPEFLGLSEMQIVFVDQQGTDNYRLGRSPRTDVRGVLRKAQEYYVFHPELKEAPSYAAAAAPAPAVAPEPQVKTSLSSPALAAAVDQFEELEESPYEDVHLSYGQYITAEGDYFVPVQLYLAETDAVAPGASVNFFGVVENEQGEVVAVYEEPVTVADSKGDAYVDRSLDLEPGKYKGTFGLAVDDKPVTIASTDLELTGIEQEASDLGGLILSNNVFALPEAQLPTDPFAFGGIKVVPKGDRVFRKSDELWYFFEMRNPGLEEGAPKVQVGVELNGKASDGTPVKMRSPLAETPAQPLKGVPNHYAVGSAIPLETFRPGEYTLSLKVIDTVNKKTWNLQETFQVVE